jgi:tetratricopeptide (TPR) repeat protein
MDEESQSPQERLQKRFPQMKPVKAAPSMFTLNGIGLSMYGTRDFDEETRTYVKTHCICVLFLPLLALGAYRVADAERGWYFLGKERLSSFAKSWNLLVAIVALFLSASVAWNGYTSSPVYRARQELKKANSFLAAGELLKAAGVYRALAVGDHYSNEAKAGLQTTLEKCLTSDNGTFVEGAFKVLAGLYPPMRKSMPGFAESFQRGLGLVDKFRAKDPEKALDIFTQVSSLDPTNSTLPSLRIGLLKDVVQSKPDNMDRAVELAQIYEQSGALSDCYALLESRQARLGSTEGARILGQHCLQEGKHDQAYGLLFPYVHARLDKLRTVERAYTNALQRASNGALDHLKHGQANHDFYDRYDKASKAEKSSMVNLFIKDWTEKDASFKRALAELIAANKIVNVTLDLGIVQLNRAQNLKDPAARKTELEAAEKTFLAIGGLAGETDEYRLFLGQVYYWLGKSIEGKALFDQLLGANKHSFRILMALGTTYRDLGDQNKAREMVEEAYKATQKNEEKYSAASLRAHIQKDVEDAIEWLEKSDPDNTATQISLNGARGEKALEQGQKELAADFLRKTIAGYQAQPRTSATLNNWGLAYLNLYGATGKREDQMRGVALMEEALSLEPGNSVLLNNIMYTLLSSATTDLARESVHLDILGERARISTLGHLYSNLQERQRIANKLRENETMKKALLYLDKALLLSPKSGHLYQTGLEIQGFFRDLPEIKKLEQRMQIAQLDFGEDAEEAKDFYSGRKDKISVEKIKSSIKRYEGFLQNPAVQQHPPTLAFAVETLADLRQTAYAYGESVDTVKMLAEAEGAWQKQQTASSLANIIAALFARAEDNLVQNNATYAELARKTRKALSPRLRFAYILDRKDPLTDEIRKNSEFTRALELIQEYNRRFPDAVSPEDWALFHNLQAEEGTAIAASFKDDLNALKHELHFRLHPMWANTILERYWFKKMVGDVQGAMDVYQRGLSKELPLPPL